MKPVVGIIMGSDSDLEIMQEAANVLKQFEVPYEIGVYSAHRSPHRTHDYVVSARERGLKVIIAGAGSSAHLAGVTAAETTLPVIGVPIDSSPLSGFDSLLSIVQMPPGVPVATMGVGKSGAVNAAILAAQILALSDETIMKKLVEYKARLEQSVAEKSKRVSESSERNGSGTDHPHIVACQKRSTFLTSDAALHNPRELRFRRNSGVGRHVFRFTLFGQCGYRKLLHRHG